MEEMYKTSKCMRLQMYEIQFVIVIFFLYKSDYMLLEVTTCINSLHVFFVIDFFFFKFTFSKKIFRTTIRVSNSLDPDQARRFVRPDPDPNCLQRLSADDKNCH